MFSLRFIPKVMFYTQSVVRSPQFAVRSPQCIFYTDRVNRHQSCLFRPYARRRAFITKTRTIILFTNTTLNRLGFRVTATAHFHFRNNETEDILVYQSNPMGVELFSYVNTFVARWVYVTHFVHRNLGEKSETPHFLLWFIQQKTAFFDEEKRVQNTQPNYSFLFIRSPTHFGKTRLQGILFPLHNE